MDTRSPGGSTNNTRRANEFQRVYKACEPCRRKKIRCVLDDSREPPGPPCLRCRRELKECIFSTERTTRRRQAQKQKAYLPHREEDDRPTENLTAYSHGTKDIHSESGIDTAIQGIPRPAATVNGSTSELSPRGDNGLTDTVMRTIVSSGNDALNLLFRAAEQRDAESPQHQTSLSLISPADGDFSTPNTAVRMAEEPMQLSKASPAVLEVWAALRFTRMGWFTAEEAVTYVDLFFRNLAPLSPVCREFDPSHDNHFWLVTQEPLLCCTVLTISSRYHILPGPGGVSRSTLIHQRLWEHCQHLIMRVIFGQEKRSKARTRTMGSIEALLLIVEWHPQAIHFPPPADGWDSDLLLSASDSRDNPLGNRCETDHPGERWLRDVVTPTKRSDRMSWMFLGCAQALAHELGVCNANESGDVSNGNSSDVQAVRKSRICKLLTIFGEQLSTRLGYMAMVASPLGRFPVVHSSGDNDDAAFMNGWMEITHLLRTISDALFPSASGTRQMLISGKYVIVIKHFQQQLLNWKVVHLHGARLKPTSYQELSIEYNHVWIFTSSLGMQAVVDRVLGGKDVRSSIDQPRSHVQAFLTATDYQFTQEVIDGSCQILQSAIKLAESNCLRFCPVRVFIRIIGASIFLLKALGLGAHTSSFQAPLAILDQSVLALRSSTLDDMHLASQYAALLGLHIARFRQRLVPSSVPPGIPAPDFNLEWDGGDAQAQRASNDADLSSDFQMPADDWLSLPFDPSMAPFGLEASSEMPEIEDSTWDFLWNLPPE